MIRLFSLCLLPILAGTDESACSGMDECLSAFSTEEFHADLADLTKSLLNNWTLIDYACMNHVQLRDCFDKEYTSCPSEEKKRKVWTVSELMKKTCRSANGWLNKLGSCVDRPGVAESFKTLVTEATDIFVNQTTEATVVDGDGTFCQQWGNWQTRILRGTFKICRGFPISFFLRTLLDVYYDDALLRNDECHGNPCRTLDTCFLRFASGHFNNDLSALVKALLEKGSEIDRACMTLPQLVACYSRAEARCTYGDKRVQLARLIDLTDYTCQNREEWLESLGTCTQIPAVGEAFETRIKNCSDTIWGVEGEEKEAVEVCGDSLDWQECAQNGSEKICNRTATDFIPNLFEIVVDDILLENNCSYILPATTPNQTNGTETNSSILAAS